jgi:hypothetical protein
MYNCHSYIPVCFAHYPKFSEIGGQGEKLRTLVDAPGVEADEPASTLWKIQTPKNYRFAVNVASRVAKRCAWKL